MLRDFRKIPMVGAALMLSAGLVLAQGPGMGRGMMGPGGPGFGMGHGLKFLTAALDLTSDQVTQAQTIFSSLRTQNQSVMQQIRSQHQAIEKAIEAGQTPAQITALAQALGPLEAQAATNNALAQAQFWALLTPQQKLIALRQSQQPPNPPAPPAN